MDLSIITVTYQSREFIDSCILSVVAHTLTSYEHIIVDNGSTDGTPELIEAGYSSYVKLIKNDRNLGFAAANNQALKEAQGKYILFLNPDMRLESSLDVFLEWMKTRPDIGLASCKLLNHSKEPYPGLRPMHYPHLFPYLLSFLKLKPFFCSINEKFFYSNFNDDLEQEVEIVRGAFMLTRREILENLGFAFDPGYFILFEDLDLCREIRKLGFKVVYSPKTSCIDYLCQSFYKQTPAWKYIQMVKSFKRYVCKWHSPLHLLWVIPASFLGFIFRIRQWGVKNSWKAIQPL